MMEALSSQRCLHHPLREAAARCPECGSFFCRECVIEHEDRVLCADCLKRLVRAPGKARGRFAWVGRVAWSAAGFMVAWIFFYEIGRTLLTIPSSFHNGTVWYKNGQ